MKSLLSLFAIILGLQATSFAYTIHNKTVVEIPLADYTFETRVGDPIDNVRTETRGLWASVGMNGSYFCPAESAYRYCGADNSTTSERIVAGVSYSKYSGDTGERGIVGVTKDGEPLFVQNNHYEWYMENTNSDRENELRYGLSNFPILLDKWVDVTTEFMHLINDRMMQKNTKSFICIPESADRIFMGFVANKSMYEMAKYLKDTYDCYFAINLDAGTSSSLVIDDKYVVWPGRKVADGFVAIPKPEYIERKINAYTLTSTQKESITLLANKFIYQIRQQGEVYKETTITMLQNTESSKRFYPLVSQRAIIRELIKQINTTQK